MTRNIYFSAMMFHSDSLLLLECIKIQLSTRVTGVLSHFIE